LKKERKEIYLFGAIGGLDTSGKIGVNPILD
jgi:hypothetical protein